MSNILTLIDLVQDYADKTGRKQELTIIFEHSFSELCFEIDEEHFCMVDEVIGYLELEIDLMSELD